MLKNWFLGFIRRDKMANLAEWIEEEADGEEIECAVIGEMGWGDYGSEAIVGYKDQPKGKL
jgi:hypothetical protein